MPPSNGALHANGTAPNGRHTASDLRPTPLLPEGYFVPASRWEHPSRRMRRLLESEPYLFAPGVYDPFTAQLAMYYGSQAAYFSGYSFAMGHVGSTDMTFTPASRSPRPPAAPSAPCGSSSSPWPSATRTAVSRPATSRSRR